ncbi:MAG: Trm112 family protein [Myxococcota bacterium]|nr:Trm112 family protein [Myxococcota bacterium]
MPVSPELIEILACPKCKGPLVQESNPEGFACKGCNLLYKIEDDIPNFIIDEAVDWKDPV